MWCETEPGHFALLKVEQMWRSKSAELYLIQKGKHVTSCDSESALQWRETCPFRPSSSWLVSPTHEPSLVVTTPVPLEQTRNPPCPKTKKQHYPLMMFVWVSWNRCAPSFSFSTHHPCICYPSHSQITAPPPRSAWAAKATFAPSQSGMSTVSQELILYICANTLKSAGMCKHIAWMPGQIVTALMEFLRRNAG